MDVNIRIAGEAGQGVQTTGQLLAGAFARAGLHVFSTPSYMSRVRGGLNWFDVRIGDVELFSGREAADLLIALTAPAFETLRGTVRPGGVVLFEGEEGSASGAMPFVQIAREAGGSAVMANSVAAGAVFAVLGYEVESLCAHLAAEFHGKPPEVVEQNVACARRGAEHAAARAGSLAAPGPVGAPATVYSGTEAVGRAAAAAGVKFVAAYPMTPSTGVFTYLAGVADEYGIVVEQAEDEPAAVNMICGATYAGVPAMATTSGGGFALMTEGVSLAGMLELPILVFVSQRPGPATGLPTRTAQQDLLFVLHAGHGEFPRAVYAPGTIPQAYALTRRALETAHRFQTPAFLLADQFLVDCRKNAPELDRTLRPIDRHVVPRPGPDYVRYALTENGVSPRALPGGEAFVVVDSDEHTPDGHITEDLSVRVRMQDKRAAKGRGLLADALVPEFYGPADARRLLVCWGSTYGPCREAVDRLRAEGEPAAMLHFAQVYPVDAERVRPLLDGRDVTFVEANATGQFAAVLREHGVGAEARQILRYDGLPFTGEEIAERVRS